jgi:dephospho-CoA kinase
MDASAKASLANRVIDTSGTLKAVDESVERCVTLLQKAFEQEKAVRDLEKTVESLSRK